MTSLSRVKTSTTAVGCCGHRTASKRANPAIREIFSLRQHPREFNICSPSPEATIALSRGPLCHYMKVAARRQHKSQFHFFIFRVQSSGFGGGNVATWRGLKIRRFQVCSFVCNEAGNYLKIGNAAFAFSLFFWESSSLAENLATFRLPGFPISPAERIFLLLAGNFFIFTRQIRQRCASAGRSDDSIGCGMLLPLLRNKTVSSGIPFRSDVAGRKFILSEVRL